ncbi:MAG: adenylate cyclase, partial [uncultured bacterium]
LAEASRKRASMEQQSGSDGRYRLIRQRFNVKDATVYAGISTSSPDLMLGLVSRAFPLLLLIFSLLSLLLFADALAALFINPVKGIGHGAAAIEAGDYSQRIEIENTDEFSLLVTSFNQMTSGLAQREKMRRFVSDNLYARLGTQVGLNELRSAQMSRVTMLAADIRGFTTLSEKHDPQQIVSLLNDYFTAMEAAINAYGGVIERFVGDAVMAVFYRVGETSGEVQAALAALAMRQKLAILNYERAGRGLFIIENGIGIASGEAASGLVGSERGRMVFTVLGKVTKLAEMLESQTKHVDSRVLLCAETARVLGERFVVQYSEKVTVCQAYELVGAKPEAEHG